MKNLIDNIVLYYFFIFRRKELERRIKANIEFAVSSLEKGFEKAILNVSLSNPMLSK